MLEPWVISTFRKYPWAEYCLHHGAFIAYRADGHMNCLVVGLVPGSPTRSIWGLK